MPLSLVPVDIVQSGTVFCSDSLPCDSTMACGETGAGLAFVDPLTLTLTPVNPV